MTGLAQQAQDVQQSRGLAAQIAALLADKHLFDVCKANGWLSEAVRAIEEEHR